MILLVPLTPDANRAPLFSQILREADGEPIVEIPLPHLCTMAFLRDSQRLKHRSYVTSFIDSHMALRDPRQVKRDSRATTVSLNLLMRYAGEPAGCP